jgi:hypothetical protein
MSMAGDVMHRSTIGKIESESAARTVSVGEAVQLARILGVDLADLITERTDAALEAIREQRCRCSWRAGRAMPWCSPPRRVARSVT